MTRQRFEGLRREMCRRIHIQFGQGKPMGKAMASLRDTKVDFAKCREMGVNSYEDIWNVTFADLRKSVGM